MRADRLAGRWAGRTVACAGSGPSLTEDDLQALRAAGLPLIVANATWQLAPWADALVAMDTAWWQHCGAAAAAGFGGERIGFTHIAPKFGATFSAQALGVASFGNSGAFAIAVAAHGGARCVLLLGYDGSPAADGRLHWHADHPAPLKNPQQSIKETWPRQFERVAEHARRHQVAVINCSRATALRCFERMPLEEALRQSATSTSSTSAACGTRMPAAPPNSSAIGPGPSITAGT